MQHEQPQTGGAKINRDIDGQQPFFALCIGAKENRVELVARLPLSSQG